MMTLQEAMEARHSVRSFTDEPIPAELVGQLQKRIRQLNLVSGLNMQLILNEPRGFGGMMAHYGSFRNVHNYIAIVGSREKDEEAERKAGYYGENLVLYAQQLGLNNCWVGLTFNKRAMKSEIQIGKGQKLIVVIAIGYGTTQGTPHKSRPLENFCDSSNKPDWFIKGVEAAMLAPTAVHRQGFYFSLQEDGKVNLTYKKGPYAAVDRGIIEYSFEAGASPHKVHFV